MKIKVRIADKWSDKGYFDTSVVLPSADKIHFVHYGINKDEVGPLLIIIDCACQSEKIVAKKYDKLRDIIGFDVAKIGGLIILFVNDAIMLSNVEYVDIDTINSIYSPYLQKYYVNERKFKNMEFDDIDLDDAVKQLKSMSKEERINKCFYFPSAIHIKSFTKKMSDIKYGRILTIARTTKYPRLTHDKLDNVVTYILNVETITLFDLTKPEPDEVESSSDTKKFITTDSTLYDTYRNEILNETV